METILFAQTGRPVRRVARVVAKAYGQAARPIGRPVSANPEGGMLFRQDRGFRLGRTSVYDLAESRDPDEKSLPQNDSI